MYINLYRKNSTGYERPYGIIRPYDPDRLNDILFLKTKISLGLSVS